MGSQKYIVGTLAFTLICQYSSDIKNSDPLDGLISLAKYAAGSTMTTGFYLVDTATPDSESQYLDFEVIYKVNKTNKNA